MDWLLTILIFFANWKFTKKRSLTFLHLFQQEDYDPKQFLSWYRQNRAFDRKGSFVAIISSCVTYLLPFLGTLLGCILIFIISYKETDPRKIAKKKLEMTERTKRIYKVTLAIACTTNLVLLAIFRNLSVSSLWLSQILTFQSIPLFLIFAKIILDPDEARRQKQFFKEARHKLKQVRPKIIGITGSYGKTSTKDALGNMLQMTMGTTFWPSKGVNTPMGITRELRSRLFPGTEYAVIEMGAYYKGSIQKLCELTPPDAAIITAVGYTHLGRFGSYENILQGKSELAQAVPKSGILICNGDNPGSRKIGEMYKKATTLFYGFEKCHHLDCVISNFQMTNAGSFFTLTWEGQFYDGFTPLFGKPNVSNAVAAFTMAAALGGNPKALIESMKCLQPVDQRLQLKNSEGIVYLHDGYNSNPTGFNAAIDLLEACNVKRRVVITPGMIELGDVQNIENEKIAERLSNTCDIALIVGNTNKEALVKGLSRGKILKENIITVSTRNEAFERLAAFRKEGDAILIENDLPDVYEHKISF